MYPDLFFCKIINQLVEVAQNLYSRRAVGLLSHSAMRRSRRSSAADFFVAPPPPIFGHRRAAAAAADFLVGAPPTQYIQVSIFSWTVL